MAIRWTWFNARLLVAVLFLSLVVAWLAHLVREQVLASQLAEFNAEVFFVHGEATSVSFRDSAHKFGVRGEPSPFGDDDLPLLEAFPRLSHLYLENTSVTNTGLGSIHRLRSLEHLDVCVEQITPERERELYLTVPGLTISKMHFIDGFRVGDGYHQ